MKAVFITAHGALLDQAGERCALHPGAGAGLRLLAELDYRLVVLDDVLPAAAAASGAGAGHGPAIPRRRRSDWLQSTPDPCPQAGAWAGRGGAVSGSAPCAHVAGNGTAGADRVARAVADADAGADAGADADACKDYCASVKGATGAPGNALDNALYGKQTACTGKLAAGPSGLRDRVADLLFREQLTMQAYYRCEHHGGACAAAAAAAPAPDRSASAPQLAVGEPSGQHAQFLASMQLAERFPGAFAGGLPGALPGAVLGVLPGVLPGVPPGASLPHPALQGGACACLPPQPRLLLQAAADHGVHLASSWMIGATLDAVEAGNRAGCRTVLIDNGTEQLWRLGRGRVPTRIAPDLHAAALLIVEEGQRVRLY